MTRCPIGQFVELAIQSKKGMLQGRRPKTQTAPLRLVALLDAHKISYPIGQSVAIATQSKIGNSFNAVQTISGVVAWWALAAPGTVVYYPDILIL